MALDINLDGLDEELVRRGVHPEVIAALSGAAPTAQPSAPGSRAYNLGVGATNSPRVSFVGPRPEPKAPDIPSQGPGVSPVSFVQPGQPAKPASFGVPPAGNPADPAVKGAPQVSFVKRYEDEANRGQQAVASAQQNVDVAKPSLARKLLAVGAGVLGGVPRGAEVWNQPRADAAANVEQVRKDSADRLAGIKTEAGIADTESQTRDRDALAEKALTPPQKEPQPKIAYHYTNPDGREVSVFEDGTEKVGGPAQAKPGKHSAGEVKLDEGIPTGIYGEGDKLWRANDPNMPAELKASLGDALSAHNKKFQEDLQKQREGRSVYAGSKSTNFVMPDGSLRTVDGLDVPQFLKDNPGAVMTGSGTTERAMSKEAQFQEIHSGIENARKAINALDRPFTPEQIGKLTLAMRHSSDPSVFKTEIETMLGSQELTPAQQDLVIWLGHLNERALSIRNIAGMGQGSDSMRAAIQAVLPGVKSGSKEMMNKQLAAFENQVQKLEKGVPKMPAANQPSNQPSKLTNPY